MTPPKDPRQHQQSRPEIQGAAVDKLVGRATDMVGATTRKQTFTGLGAVKPPPLPLEHAETVKAPAQPPLRKTWRLPTPPSALAAARRTDPPVASAPPPTSIRVPADEAPASELQSSQESILRDELARERARSAKLERDARASAEARIQSFPPPVEQQQRHASPAPSSVPSSMPPGRGDWAKLRYKVATAIVASLVLVIAALGYWAVTAINAKTEAIKAAQEAKRHADNREAEWRQWASVVIWIEDCRDSRDVRSGEMLLPDPQKMGSARKLEPWQNPCSPKLPPPP